MPEIRLWEIPQRATNLARYFSKIPPDRNPFAEDDFIWVPRSIIEHVTSHPIPDLPEWKKCVVTLPEWFLRKKGL